MLVQILILDDLHLCTARCISECDEALLQENYSLHVELHSSIQVHNVTVDLRDAEGSNDELKEFGGVEVCPWYYEEDFNSSRLPQVLYTARCNATKWCNHRDGYFYKCKTVTQLVPILIGTNCNLFKNTEWALEFEERAVGCYASQSIEFSFEETCPMVQNQ